MADGNLWSQPATWRLLGYATCAGTGVGLLIAWGLIAGLSKSDWASWVQAVGSIGALLLAFWLGHRDTVRRRLDEETQRRASIDYALSTVQYAVYVTIEHLKAAGKMPTKVGFPMTERRLMAVIEVIRIAVEKQSDGRALVPLMNSEMEVARVANFISLHTGNVWTTELVMQVKDVEIPRVHEAFNGAHERLVQLRDKPQSMPPIAPNAT